MRIEILAGFNKLIHAGIFVVTAYGDGDEALKGKSAAHDSCADVTGRTDLDVTVQTPTL